MSESLFLTPYTNDVKRIFVHESEDAAKDFLAKNELTINGTPLLIPFKNNLGRIEFLKPVDKENCIRIMGAGNKLRDKNAGEKFIDWWNKIVNKDFAPHLNDLEGESILLEKNGLIVVYQRAEKDQGPKKVGTVLAEFFREQKEELREEIDRSNSNDGAQLNIGKFTSGLSKLGISLGIAAGMNYFIKDDEVFRHTFKEGVSNKEIERYLKAEEAHAKAKNIRALYNKTEDNHYWPFLKDLAKGAIFAAITALGVGFITLIFLASVITAPIAAFIAAPIAAMTFAGLCGVAFYKASKDNQKTMKHGKTEFETIKPEAAKQKNSIFNKLKFYLVMVLDYLRGKSSETKQPVNQVSQPVPNEIAVNKLSGVIPVKNEMAELQPPVTEPKVIPVEQNPIPRTPVHTTKPVMKVAPIPATELPKQPMFFKVKKVAKKAAKIVETGLKYQGCPAPVLIPEYAAVLALL